MLVPTAHKKLTGWFATTWLSEFADPKAARRCESRRTNFLEDCSGDRAE
jgi:hypothetical protein